MSSSRVAFIFITLFFTACSGSKPTLPPAERYDLASNAVGKEILDLYLWEASQIEALSAGISIDLRKGPYSKTIDVSTAFELPNKLRIEILPPAIGPPLLLVTSDGQDLGALRRADRVAYLGRAEDLSTVLGLPFDRPLQLARWLTGKIPLTLRNRIIKSTFHTQAGNSEGILELALEDGKRYRFLLSQDRSKPRISIVELFERGEKKLVVRYSYSNSKGSDGLPNRIETWIVEDGFKLNTTFKSSKLNPVWDKRVVDKLFKTKIPRSFQKLPISALGESILAN